MDDLCLMFGLVLVCLEKYMDELGVFVFVLIVLGWRCMDGGMYVCI